MLAKTSRPTSGRIRAGIVPMNQEASAPIAASTPNPRMTEAAVSLFRVGSLPAGGPGALPAPALGSGPSTECRTVESVGWLMVATKPSVPAGSLGLVVLGRITHQLPRNPDRRGLGGGGGRTGRRSALYGKAQLAAELLPLDVGPGEGDGGPRFG